MNLSDFVFTEEQQHDHDTVNSYYCNCSNEYRIWIWALLSVNHKDIGRPITDFESGKFNFQVDKGPGTFLVSKTKLLRSINFDDININNITSYILCKILYACGGERAHKNFCTNCEIELLTDNQLCYACEKGI